MVGASRSISRLCSFLSPYKIEFCLADKMFLQIRQSSELCREVAWEGNLGNELHDIPGALDILSIELSRKILDSYGFCIGIGYRVNVQLSSGWCVVPFSVANDVALNCKTKCNFGRMIPGKNNFDPEVEGRYSIKGVHLQWNSANMLTFLQKYASSLRAPTIPTCAKHTFCKICRLIKPASKLFCLMCEATYFVQLKLYILWRQIATHKDIANAIFRLYLLIWEGAKEVKWVLQ